MTQTQTAPMPKVEPSFILGGNYEWHVTPGRRVLEKAGTSPQQKVLDMLAPLDLTLGQQIKRAIDEVDEQGQYAKRDAPRSNHDSPATFDPGTPEPKNIAEAISTGYHGFEATLRDPSVGHQQVANRYSFTTESSVRRWRKKNEVEVSR